MADYFFTNATGRAQLVATIADAFYQYAVSTPG